MSPSHEGLRLRAIWGPSTLQLMSQVWTVCHSCPQTFVALMPCGPMDRSAGQDREALRCPRPSSHRPQHPQASCHLARATGLRADSRGWPHTGAKERTGASSKFHQPCFCLQSWRLVGTLGARWRSLQTDSQEGGLSVTSHDAGAAQAVRSRGLAVRTWALCAGVGAGPGAS